ncbi:MAG: TOBE domain-containing protein [Halolamina sp.]|jgi:molybdate transport system regulatory protein|uniref:TOBE domain-containing protein n=1 Tax=Halolamina sp. TaxID=1940283 RepID=UPI002FC357D5
MDAEFDAQLRADDVAFDGRDAALLRAVDDAGSLNAAAETLGRSYSRAHGRLTDLEAAFGDLVERRRGGESGGGSTLTARAHELLARFDRLRAGYSSVAETAEAVLDGTVEERNGELGTVSTAAGRVRALVPPGAEAVQVSLRADTVTLHDPAEMPDESATSARNRFDGEVTAIDRGEAISRVTVDVGADAPLAALVTEESRERLSLATGRQVVASFKATATRATAK